MVQIYLEWPILAVLQFLQYSEHFGKKILEMNMKQTRPHLQISPLGLVNEYGSKNPKTSQKQESLWAYGTAVSRVDILLN